MIAWYSRARSWFNNSISSERDILNTSRSRFIFQKRFSSGLSAVWLAPRCCATDPYLPDLFLGDFLSRVERSSFADVGA